MAIENPPDLDAQLPSAQADPEFDPTSIRRCLTVILSVAATIVLIFLTPALVVLINVLSYRPGLSLLAFATVFSCLMCVYGKLEDNKDNPQARLRWAGLYRRQALIVRSLVVSALLFITTLVSMADLSNNRDVADILLSPPPAVGKVMDTATPEQLENFARSRGQRLDAYRFFGVSGEEEGFGHPWQDFAYALSSPASRANYWECKETVAQYLASPRRSRLRLSVNGRGVDEKRLDPCAFSRYNTLQLKLLR